MCSTDKMLTVQSSGAPIHHSAYQFISWFFCYINIGTIIADIKSIDR